MYSFIFLLLQCQSLSLTVPQWWSCSGTLITLEPFLEHCGAVNTVSMETSSRHTLISGLEQLYFSDDEWNLKSWEDFNWRTQLNAANLFGEGSTQAEESVWFLIMRLITNDSYLVLPKAPFGSASLVSPASPRLTPATNGKQFPNRFYFTNGYIDLVQLFSSS